MITEVGLGNIMVAFGSPLSVNITTIQRLSPVHYLTYCIVLFAVQLI